MESKVSYICKTALELNSRISTVTSQERCRYHSEDSKTFDASQLTPDGLCIHAFHSVYSACLKFLYTEIKNNVETSIVCPETNGSVEFEVMGVKHANIRHRVLNTLKYYLRRVGIPCDYQMRRIFIKVTSVKKPCPMKHREGDIFEFNLGNKPEM